MSYYFQGKRKLQTTWRALIRIQLSLRDENDVTTEAVRSFQSSRWGRSKSNTCLLELLPLPSPGVDVWRYDEWTSATELPELLSRAKYTRRWAPTRATALHQLVRTHAPRTVVLYGTSADLSGASSVIAGFDWSLVEPVVVSRGNKGQPFRARFRHRDSTLFALVYHPSYLGITNEYFHTVGQELRERQL